MARFWREWGRRIGRRIGGRPSGFAQIEEALRRLLAEDGLGDVVCRAASLDGGALLLAADNPSACARLRQMRDSLLGRLQEQFPDIQELRFGVRP